MLTATQQNDEIGGFTHQPEAMEVGLARRPRCTSILPTPWSECHLLDVLRQRGGAGGHQRSSDGSAVAETRTTGSDGRD